MKSEIPTENAITNEISSNIEEFTDVENIISRLRENTAMHCVTVTIPTHRKNPDKAVDPKEVNRVLKIVRDNLVLKYGKKVGSGLADRLEALEKTFDYTHSTEGLGLYVSEEISQLIKFPFNVTEKISVSNKFDFRDLLYMRAHLEEYIVLSVTKDVTNLYRGRGTELKEIVNQDFPRKYTDDYEYMPTYLGSSIGYSLKSVERDPSVIAELRFESFLKEVDKLLNTYLQDNKPFILATVKQEQGFFQKVTNNAAKISGKIVGNYSYESLAEFGNMAFEQITEYRNKLAEEHIANLTESIGKEMAVTGIRSVWKNAAEGKGMLLLVEKDFAKPGFVKRDDHYNLLLTPPVENHNIIGDAVEAIMETVLEKNGKISFVDNGTLTNHDQIALLLRYQ
jgi:hypothetical protein